MAVSFNNLTSRHQGSKSRQHVLQQDMIYGTPPGDTTIRSLFIHKQRPFLEEEGKMGAGKVGFQAIGKCICLESNYCDAKQCDL